MLTMTETLTNLVCQQANFFLINSSASKANREVLRWQIRISKGSRQKKKQIQLEIPLVKKVSMKYQKLTETIAKLLQGFYKATKTKGLRECAGSDEESLNHRHSRTDRIIISCSSFLSHNNL